MQNFNIMTLQMQIMVETSDMYHTVVVAVPIDTEIEGPHSSLSGVYFHHFGSGPNQTMSTN